MKKSLFIVLMVVLSTIGIAQEAKKELSNAEMFSAKSGVIIEKEFIDIGTYKQIEVQVLHYKDLIEDKSISSLRFSYDAKTTYGTDTKIASLDTDEIDGLVKSIEIMLNDVITTSPANYKEVLFRSRSGFEAGCFFVKNKWSTYLKIEKYDSNSNVFLKTEDFQELLKLIKQAQQMLK